MKFSHCHGCKMHSHGCIMDNNGCIMHWCTVQCTLYCQGCIMHNGLYNAQCTVQSGSTVHRHLYNA